MRQLRIHHETRYAFPAPVTLGQHQLRLRPREGPDLHIDASVLETEPAAQVRWTRDPFDNAVATLAFETAPVSSLTIVSGATVRKYDDAPLDFIISDHAVSFPFAYEPEDADVLTPFLANVSGEERRAAEQWAAQARYDAGPIQTYALLDRLCCAIHGDFAYQIREEPGVQSAQTTLTRRAGSCRDFANLFIESARALGLAARFVSGYRYEPGLPVELAATHAWTEVYLPGAGWKGFDPTIGALSGPNHIATAVARSPSAAPPVTGVFHGPAAGATMNVQVEVTALSAMDL